MNSASPPPENSSALQQLIAREVRARLTSFGLAIGVPLFVLGAGLVLLLAWQIWQNRKLAREVSQLRADAVRLGQPIEIYNPAWGTVIDAVDPQRIPSRDVRDPRYGALVQQFTPRGNSAQSFQLRKPSTNRPASEALPEQAYIKHASSFLRARDFVRAIEAFNYCLSIYPESAEALNGRGIALRDQGTFVEALESHDRAVELAPGRANFLWERALTRQRSGDLARAITDCEAALKQNPHFADAYNTMAIVYRSQGIYTNALAQHERALELGPEREDFWRERGVTYQAQGDQQKANADAARARELRDSSRKPVVPRSPSTGP
jgi:tetratricopeptide (TPR) repeat protein